MNAEYRLAQQRRRTQLRWTEASDHDLLDCLRAAAAIGWPVPETDLLGTRPLSLLELAVVCTLSTPGYAAFKLDRLIHPGEHLREWHPTGKTDRHSKDQPDGDIQHRYRPRSTSAPSEESEAAAVRTNREQLGPGSPGLRLNAMGCPGILWR